MRELGAYLKQRWRAIGAFFLFSGVFAVVFALYDLPAEAVVYAAGLCLPMGLALLGADYVGCRRRHQALRRLLKNMQETAPALPPARDAVERDYQALVQALCADRARIASQQENIRRDMLDYYTLWVHQIKTPIAAMHLLLQRGGGPSDEVLSAELLKVEEYVEMALNYLRLGGDSTDYVLRRCCLDEVVRACLRKYARLFILKKLSLEFEETNRTVLSDEKWLAFVLGQVLSNAIQYTPQGGCIRIYGDGETLVVADSGIGIREEDLPRIFEKGFTGYNGRENRKSTGIGLYLCRRVLANLGHEITVTSRPGQGTLVRLLLPEGAAVTE